MKKKAVFNWSGGKDSALALQKVLQEEQYEVVALLTTVNHHTGASSMHLIPEELLEAQAASIGIPLRTVRLASEGGLEGYEEAMTEVVEEFKAQGVRHFIFGDILLHDVKAYREKQLHPVGIEVVEPLWDKTTEEVMEEFLASGLQTLVVVTQADVLDERFVGRILNRDFVRELPAGADPCGENGEYHTFCFDGPMFKTSIAFQLADPEKMSYKIRHDDGSLKEYFYWKTELVSAAR